MMYKVLAVAFLVAVNAAVDAPCGNNVGVGAGGCASDEVCIIKNLAAGSSRTCQKIPPQRAECIPKRPTDAVPPTGCTNGKDRSQWSAAETKLIGELPVLGNDGTCNHLLAVLNGGLYCVRCLQLAGTSAAYPNGVWGDDLNYNTAKAIQSPGRWCPRGDTCTTDRCLAGVCTSNLNCAYTANFEKGASGGSCYCDESCLTNSPPDCCPHYEENCVVPVEVPIEPGLCGHVNRGLREFCPDNVGDVFRPAWAIRFSRRGGCADPEPDMQSTSRGGQPDNVRCIPGREIGMDRDYYRFACAGVTQDIVTMRCRSNDCSGNTCDKDWSVFMNGDVQAGKCFSTLPNDTGDHWMFVCDPLDFFEFPK